MAFRTSSQRTRRSSGSSSRGGKVNGSLLAAGVVDEISVLVAPAIDGALDVAGASGLVGKAWLRFLTSDRLEHGLVHLWYGGRGDVGCPPFPLPFPDFGGEGEKHGCASVSREQITYRVAQLIAEGGWSPEPPSRAGATFGRLHRASAFAPVDVRELPGAAPKHEGGVATGVCAARREGWTDSTKPRR